MRYQVVSEAAILAALVSLSLGVAACGGNDLGGPAGVGAPAAGATPGSSAVSLTSTADTLLVDQSLRLTATVPSVLGGAPTAAPVWTSSDSTIATVSQSGLVFALKSGRSIVSVTSRGSSAATTIVVKASVRSVQFDTDTLAIGLSQSVQLPFHVIDSDGNAVDLSARKVEWTSTAPDIVPVSETTTITGRTLGSADVRLTVDGKASMVRVQVKPQSVASVTITPSKLTVGVGQQTQLSARVSDASGNVLPNRIVNWSSSDPAIAAVSSTGSLTPIRVGIARISAVSENKRDAATINVTAQPDTTPSPTPPAPTPVASVSVALNSSALTIGQSTQANAVLRDSASNALTGRTVAWTTSDATIASVSESGQVSALKAGSATITGSAEGKSGSAVVVVSVPVLVPMAITVSTNASTIRVGELTQASAIVKDANGTAIPNTTVTWSTAPATIATISSNGLVLGRIAGSATVSASASGVTGSATITVIDTATTTPPGPGVPAGPTVTRGRASRRRSRRTRPARCSSSRPART
jgi:uncharacterized protein YjdB